MKMAGQETVAAVWLIFTNCHAKYITSNKSQNVVDNRLISNISHLKYCWQVLTIKDKKYYFVTKTLFTGDWEPKVHCWKDTNIYKLNITEQCFEFEFQNN